MRRLVISVALIAGLALSGCTTPVGPEASPTESGTTSTSTSTSTLTPTPTPTSTIDAVALEQGFIDTVRGQAGEDLDSYADAGLLEVGQSVCESLRAGVPVPVIETALTDTGFTKSAAENVILGAGILLCNDQGAKVINGW